MELLKGFNLLLAFLLELVLLYAVGLWGFQASPQSWLKWLLGVGLPLLVAVFWGLVLSPRAGFPPPEPFKLLLKLLVFAGGAAALVLAGKAQLGYGFAVVAALNLLLAEVWKQ